MVTPDSDEGRHSALASPTRREIMRILEDSSGPLDAASIAEKFDLHITTARFHLDQLERASLVRRVVHRGGRRGRPRITFTPFPVLHDGDPQRQLNSVLADALASDTGAASVRARDAGERWAQTYSHEIDANADDVEEPLMRVFDQIGFAPESREREPESVIALSACPFRDVARSHPDIVCEAHRGLLDGIMNLLGRDDDEAALFPLVEPELCLVRLHSSLEPNGSGSIS